MPAYVFLCACCVFVAHLLATQGVVHRPAALAYQRAGEIQHLWPHLRPTESEYAFMVLIHSQV